MNGLISEIAASANEQATSLTEVNTAVAQMDQRTQQNAAMVKETTAASHALAADGRELSRQVACFRIDAAVAPPPVRASEPTRDRAGRNAQLRRATAGGAARKLEPAADAEADSWEEF